MEGQAQSLPGRLIAVFSRRGDAGITSPATDLGVTVARMWKMEVPLIDTIPDFREVTPTALDAAELPSTHASRSGLPEGGRRCLECFRLTEV